MTAKTPKSENALNEVAEPAKPKTCFVMMPISDVDGYPPGHFTEVFKQLIAPAVTDAGYKCELATSTNSAHMIQVEVVTKVATSDLCICDLSTNNPNVLFEYGIRQAFDKPTVLIKDNITRRLFDLSGFRDIEYDHTLRISNILDARTSITKAIEQTVQGSTDESQIFSLVSLMKLTKAALPSGDISRDDARFALLEQKLDRLSLQLNSNHEPTFNAFAQWVTKDANEPTRTFVFPKYILRVEPSGLIYSDKESGNRTVYDSLDALENEAWWVFMPEKTKTKILNSIRSNRTF